MPITLILPALLALCATNLSAAAPAAEHFWTAVPESARATVAVPAPSAPAREEKDWTVMVYLNGKNSMEDMAMLAANKIESIGSTDKVNIVLELGRIKGYSSDDGNWTGSRRYLVRRDDTPFALTSHVLAEFPKVDMGDHNHLAEFGRWARENYPAKRYMLVVWYGDGWRAKGRSMSFDEETYSRITTPQLGQALARIGKVDIFSADAGMMQMAEIGYELRPYADHILASEETSPGEGNPYDYTLSRLIYDPGITPEDLGNAAVGAFYDYYSEIEFGTQSLVRTAALPRLRGLLDAWTAAVMAAGETALVKRARDTAQAYVYTDNKDLYDFVRLVTEGTAAPAVRSGGEELMAFIKKDLVVSSCFIADELANSHGIAVYLPLYKLNPDYAGLAWARDSSWDEFAQWVLKIK